MKKSVIIICLAVSHLIAHGQPVTRVNILPGEKWYGAAVNEGEKMPFSEGYFLNLNADTKGNQAAPLLLSSKGRYVWSDNPFSFAVTENELVFSEFSDTVIVGSGGTDLKGAYLKASKMFFPPTGLMPDVLLFEKPQYNTWIELIYNQNQDDILKYAHDIIDNGFPPGVIMIDDNWAPAYGNFKFRKDRFPDAAAMVNELHSMGFKVMLWVCPFISPDSEVSRDLLKRKLVLMHNEGNSGMTWAEAKTPSIINWWNGYSMVMDFTNPDAVEWFTGQLNNMVTEYSLDGFKFDAGDPEYYPENSVSYIKITPNEHTELWGLFGLDYPLNEYRAMWKRGNEPIVERLRDKFHTWSDLRKLVPHITVASLLGYTFACPDMIGGGDYSSFISGAELDQELIVRSAQCHALMPMMQFSVAPWRVLDGEHLEAVKKAVETRQSFVPYIMRLASISAKTGEPIVRNMEYEFPHQGFEDCRDQFMLGDSILVAPMLEGGNSREVIFPAGSWKDKNDRINRGPVKKRFTVPLDELLWFKKN